MKILATLLALLLLPTSPVLAESRYAQARELGFQVVADYAAAGICPALAPTTEQRQAISAALAQVEPLTPEPPDPRYTAAFTNPALLTERNWLDPLIIAVIAVIADDTAMLDNMEATGHPLQARAGSLLQDAAYFGSRQVLDYLLARGATPDTTSDTHATAQIAATANGRLDIARTLLQAGASPNLVPRSGTVPLVHAVGCRNQPMVDLLLSSGATPNERVRQLAIKHGMSLDVANR